MIDLSMRLRGAPVAVFDTETTGSAADDRICEIGIVVIERLWETEPKLVLSTLVDPEREIGWGSTKVHGIRDRDVVGKPTWERVWPQVAELLALHVPCAFNASFDLRFLTQEASNICSALAVPTLDQTLDPLPLVRKIDAPADGKKPGKGYMSLSSACERRNIRKGEHRAGSDAMATAKLLVRLIGEAYKRPELSPPPAPTVAQWLAWQRQPGGAGALPMALVAPSAPIEGTEAKVTGTRGARLCWVVKGAPIDPKLSHLAGMYLRPDKGMGGEWRWTMYPVESKVRLFETQEEAAAVGRKCQGEAVFLAHRAGADAGTNTNTGGAS